jgi:CheY-like chemotaxis protein
VLVNDDQDSIADAIAEELSTRCEVVVARTGQEALAAVEAGWFDAILCDLRMPGLDGRAVHEIVRARSERQARRFVFVTGDVRQGTHGSSRQSGGLPVLLKPFSFEAMWERVDAALRQAP